MTQSKLFRNSSAPRRFISFLAFAPIALALTTAVAAAADRGPAGLKLGPQAILFAEQFCEDGSRSVSAAPAGDAVIEAGLLEAPDFGSDEGQASVTAAAPRCWRLYLVIDEPAPAPVVGREDVAVWTRTGAASGMDGDLR